MNAVKPYYEHAGITIYHGDCSDVIEQWEGLRTQSFDLLLTDPPYGVLANTGSAATRRSGGNLDDGRMAWDVAPSAETLARLIAITKTQMIWGGWHLSLPPTFGYLVWDKQIDGRFRRTPFDHARREGILHCEGLGHHENDMAGGIAKGRGDGRSSDSDDALLQDHELLFVRLHDRDGV